MDLILSLFVGCLLCMDSLAYGLFVCRQWRLIMEVLRDWFYPAAVLTQTLKCVSAGRSGCGTPVSESNISLSSLPLMTELKMFKWSSSGPSIVELKIFLRFCNGPLIVDIKTFLRYSYGRLILVLKRFTAQ
jgi:hypothetical protein